jgi:hypothetical protein
MNTELTQEQKDAAIQAAREQQASVTAQAAMLTWDRAMNRAFKGIVSRPKRRANLIKSLERLDGES